MSVLTDILLEVAADLAGICINCIPDNSFSSLDEGNKDYTSKELMDGVKYGTDIYKKDFDVDVYKELKSLYRKKLLSKDEYEHLVNHQRILDAYNKQIEILKNIDHLPKRKAYENLKELEELTSLLYKEEKIQKDRYLQIMDLIEKKRIEYQKQL